MDVITTHTNTDFDAFASLVAARRLYPGAVAALPGSMNRNVREFFRLHADELEIADTGTVDHEAIERLIVVETVHAERMGEFEEVALRPGIELVVFDHHQPERPEWLPEESLVLSEDGALTTTLVGILAEREIEPTPLEATVFALGIHEDTGSLTYPAVTQRDADALGWCLRHGARQDMIAQYLHTPLGTQERALFEALVTGIETHDAGGFEVLVTAVAWPEYVDGISNLVHKLIDLTDARGLVALVEMGERVFCVSRTRVAELDASALAGALGGGGHTQAASAVYPRIARRRALAACCAALPGAVRRAAHRGRDHVAPAAVRLRRRHGRARDGRVPAAPPERHSRRRAREARGRRHAGGSRQGRRPRSRARSGEERHDRDRGHLRRGDPARRGAAARLPDRRGANRGRHEGHGRRRGHAQRRAARARRARGRGAARRRQPGRRAAGTRGIRSRLRGRGRRVGAVRRRVPRGRRRARRPHGRADLRPRHRRRRETGSRSAARSRRRSAAAPSRTRSSAPRS